MYYSKCFNYNCRYFVGYETCDKLILTSSEGFININITSKQSIPKSNTNMTSPSATLGFGCSSHKDTCDILSENLVTQKSPAYSSINEGDVLRYIKQVK